SLDLLPWQHLCYPDDHGNWTHLRLWRNLPFAVHVATTDNMPVPLLDRREFRALVVVASPPKANTYQLDWFDTAATVAGLRQALGRIPCTVLADVGEANKANPVPTRDKLKQYLGQEQPSWLHLVCHGRVSDELGESVLYLRNDQGGVAGIAA